MDALTALFRKGEQCNLFQPLSRWGIKHRLSVYADDAVLLLRPDVNEAEATVQLLAIFGNASGLVCNMAKSSISLIRCQQENITAVTTILECSIKEFPVTYLGLPLSYTRLPKAALQPLIDRTANYLPTWKARYLRRAGRLVLINSTLTASSIYHMLVLDLPAWFISCIDKIRRGFFWCGHDDVKGGNCLVNWKLVCTPKAYGGLGVHNLGLLNQALLLKWRWYEKVAPDKPWQGLDIGLPVDAEGVFAAGLHCSLGNGQRLGFWTDRWINGSSLMQLAPSLTNFVKPAAKHRTVADALHNNAWLTDLRGNLDIHAIVDIVSIWPVISNQTLTNAPDEFRWKQASDGVFSASTAYKLFFLGCEFLPGAAELWTSWAPLEIKIFVWLALHNRLWTADRLARRHLEHPDRCVLCCQEEEDLNHMLLGCSFAREVWFNVLLPWRLHRLTPTPEAKIQDWWPALSNATSGGRRRKMNTLVCLVLRCIWLERNSRVFNKVATMPHMVTRRINEEFKLWMRAKIGGIARDVT